MSWPWFAIKLLLFTVVAETLFLGTLHFCERWLNRRGG
jgi:hypothetical protein